MGNDRISELKVLEQIRNLLALHLLRSNTASNAEIAEILNVTPGRVSQLFAKVKPKRGKKSKSSKGR